MLDSLISDFRYGLEITNISRLIDEFLSDQLYTELIDTSWFKRLLDIPFLGALTYISGNDDTKSRGHHSFCVGLLAYYYSRLNNFDKKDERIWVLSGLLHDIHHLPFSHTMEFALNHGLPSFSLHDCDRKIIFKKNSNDDNESISDIAGRYNIDIENEAFIFKPLSMRPALFGSTHNLDTLEGIYRVYLKYFHAPSDKYYSLPTKVIEAFCSNRSRKGDVLPEAIGILDCFWEIKNYVYFKGIYDKKKVFFERTLSSYLLSLCLKNDLVDKLYRLTDKDLFAIFPCLLSQINMLWTYIDSSSDNYNKNIYLDNDKLPVVKCSSSSKPLKFKNIIRRFMINFKERSSLEKRYQTSSKFQSITLDSNAERNILSIITPLEGMLDFGGVCDDS